MREGETPLPGAGDSPAAATRSPESADTLVRMPKLADTLVEGTVGQWLKQVGETVGKGEPLVSIETDKVTTELTSPASGTILELLVSAGNTVPIDTPIARIGQPGRELTAAPLAVAPPKPASTPPPRPTPLAAKLLVEHGLSADQVPARSIRLTRDEVLAFVQSQRAAPADNLIPLSPMRRAIAEHMTRAHQTIPHGQTVMDADLTDLVAWRDQHKASFLKQEGANLTFTVLFVHALARCLAAHTNRDVDIGVAVALDAGLIVPVLRNVDSLSIGQTARGIAEVAERARANKLAVEDTQGATMTVTNVGSFGNLTAAPIVPLGQIGILGPGLVERRPLPGPRGAIRPGWRCLLSLVFDRRALADFEADRLLRATVTELVQLPSAVPSGR